MVRPQAWLPRLQTPHVATSIAWRPERQTRPAGMCRRARGARSRRAADARSISLLLAARSAGISQRTGRAEVSVDGRAYGRAQHVQLRLVVRANVAADLRTRNR